MRPTDEELTARLRESIGRETQGAREAQGLSQAEVAARIGKAQPYYGRLERGKALPSLETLSDLMRALGVSADALLDTENLADAAALEYEDPLLADIAEMLQADPERCDLVMALVRAVEGAEPPFLP